MEARKPDHTDAKDVENLPVYDVYVLHLNLNFLTVIVSTLAYDKYIGISFTTLQVIRAIFQSISKARAKATGFW